MGRWKLAEGGGEMGRDDRQFELREACGGQRRGGEMAGDGAPGRR